MALCDYLLDRDILGYDCASPPVKGVYATGLLINRSDIDHWAPGGIILKCGGKKAYKVVQGGKTPFNGTQQEMQEGVYQNTLTNTLQIVVLRQDENWAEQLNALINGEFVAVLRNKAGNYQAFGLEAGLHCTGAVRELYNDDTLAGWQITFTEEGATRSLFITGQNFSYIQNETLPCNVSPEPYSSPT